MVYLATARSGKAGQALEELKAAKFKNTEAWDVNVIDFILGRIDEDELRKRPLKGTWSKQEAACTAQFHIGQSHLIAGKVALARPALEAAITACKDRAFESSAAQMDLDRLPK
ncbi:hypothetical protein C7C56_018380 [Massilia glaciei]|uniref:Uncharacterized protein n=2 Tax=Massilia glaciei TaxID=1524097 RepID=A0A2U2HH31_9BURK|nr:hypothetical protein C7C56_018380 [Massilia glaciei]